MKRKESKERKEEGKKEAMDRKDGWNGWIPPLLLLLSCSRVVTQPSRSAV